MEPPPPPDYAPEAEALVERMLTAAGMDRAPARQAARTAVGVVVASPLPPASAHLAALDATLLVLDVATWRRPAPHA